MGKLPLISDAHKKEHRESLSPYFRQTRDETHMLADEVSFGSSCASAALKPLFNGMSEEEILQMKLPDILAEKLDIVFVGINPGLRSASLGHHFAGRNNHFWPCIRNSGLLPDDFCYNEDFKAVSFGIGLTNVVERTTRAAADLSRLEIRQGVQSLVEKLAKLKPLLVCFNGKGLYETITGKRCQLGLQNCRFPQNNALIYVMPSTSGRTRTHPRFQDKLVFFKELKRLRDELKGACDMYMDEND